MPPYDGLITVIGAPRAVGLDIAFQPFVKKLLHCQLGGRCI